jgi:hypothetical protein
MNQEMRLSSVVKSMYAYINLKMREIHVFIEYTYRPVAVGNVSVPWNPRSKVGSQGVTVGESELKICHVVWYVEEAGLGEGVGKDGRSGKIRVRCDVLAAFYLDGNVLGKGLHCSHIAACIHDQRQPILTEVVLLGILKAAHLIVTQAP